MILFDGVQSLDVSGPLDVLAGANSCRSRRNGRAGTGWLAGKLQGAEKYDASAYLSSSRSRSYGIDHLVL